MALIIADRVQETTATTGTGTINLAGASAQHQTFISAIGSGNTTYYCITSGNGSDWETGIGTVTAGSPNTLARTTILASTNANAAINLSGTSTVYCTSPAYFLNNSGLYGAAYVAGGVGVPTSASTGFTSWTNQGGASVANGTTGIVLTAPTNAGDSWRLRTKTAPTAPYTITVQVAHVAVVNFSFTGIGWTDGTKLHGIYVGNQSSTTTRLAVGKWNTVSSFSANDFTGADGLGFSPIWLQIQDDGTNVKFRYGFGGSIGSNSDLLEVFSVAKTSGFLGGSGYSSLWFGVDNNATGKNALGTMLAYIQVNA
jgi:hypothetical protein